MPLIKKILNAILDDDSRAVQELNLLFLSPHSLVVDDACINQKSSMSKITNISEINRF
jgi:hypothetical protein